MTRQISIHPTALVSPDVEIGRGTIIGPFATIVGPCSIGDDCWIGPSTVIGTTGEDVGSMIVQSIPIEGAPPSADELWFGSHGIGVVIGDRTIIREFTTINSGTRRPTTIGSDVFVMNSSYVAHDVILGDRVRLSPHAAMGGHSTAFSDANIGMNASVHQYRVVGHAAMVGMQSAVIEDVRPLELVKGVPARGGAVNRIWLERSGVEADDIEAIARHLAGRGEMPVRFAAEFSEWERVRSTRRGRG